MTGLPSFLRQWFLRLVPLIASSTVCFVLSLSTAHAIDFNFTYNAGASTVPGDVSDSFGPINDANGSALMGIADVAGEMWGDVILDNVTINIELRYQSPSNSGNSAQAFTFASHPDNTNGDPSTDGSRILWGRIIFNPNRKWWVDSTPLSHSEFDMQQTLFRDLPGAQQTGWFDGSPPTLLEAGYSGAVNGTAPAAMQFDASQPANIRSRDMLSYALHEIGHMLGVNSTSTAQNEYGTDGDYDITSSLAGGSVFAIESTSTSDGHITSSPTSPTAPTLMHSNNLCCVRRLPSALDVMAMESTANWTSIRLLRTDFLTGNSWNTAGNWEGDRTPSTAVDAFVRHGGTVTLSGFGAAGNLLVDEGSVVSTQDHTLFVQNSTTVGGTSGDTSQITINTNGQLDSDILNINFDGRVRLVSNSSLLESERINISSGGTLEGRGTIDLNDNLFGQLTSNGRIRVTGGELVIQSQNGLALDLQSGVVEAINGNLRFETGFLDAMGADLTVGAGRQVAFNSGGSIGAGGLLNLIGQSGSPATSTGSTLFVGLNGVVNGNGLGVVENVLVLLPSSFVTTQFGDPNSEIRLNGTTFMQGGRIGGLGTARQNGEVVVSADTLITINTYDMDGQFGNTTITIGAGNTLQINSPNIDATGLNDFDGTLEVNGGTLHMVPDWTLDGTLNLTQNGSTAVLTGPGRLTVSTTGVINVSGAGRIESDVTLAGELFVASEADFNGNTIVTATAQLETDSPGDVIDFNGPTILGGGSYVGGGLIRFDGDIQVIGNTSIGMADADLDGDSAQGSISIAPGVTFSVASTTLDPSDGAYDAVMNVRGTFSSIVTFRLDGTLNLIQGNGQAAPQINGLTDFVVRTSGMVNTDGDTLINRNTIIRGDINIGAGVTQINGTALFENSASVMVAAGGTLELTDVSTYLGGSHTGLGLIRFNGETHINANTSIDTARIDLDGSAENTIIHINDATFALHVDTVDATNNLFGGTINVVGENAQLAVNLTNPLTAWRLSSSGVLNFNNPAAAPATMLTGSDLSAEGIINGTGRVVLAVNMSVQNRLNSVTALSDVHFAGSDRTTVHANPTATIAGTGSITIDNGTTVNLEGQTLVAVSTENVGRLEIGFEASEVSIDYTVPATATIRGTFSQAAVGEFAVDLGGLLQSTEYDLLVVIGTARLNGVIEATLIDDFVPAIGNTFQVLTATQVIGQFDSVETIDSNDVLGFVLTDIYSPTDVMLRVDDVFLIGDYNDDGIVSAADYTIWRDNLGALAGTLPNDIDGGPIGQSQYETWKSHFGNQLPSPGSLAGGVVPEPTSAMLLAIVLSAVCLMNRRSAPERR